MMKFVLRSLLLFVAVAGLIGMPGPLQAAPITGSVGFGGGFTPVDGLGNPVGLDLATGIDFGFAIAVSASGDLASSIIPFSTLGAFTDFQFSPVLNPVPVEPLWQAGGFQFLLDDVSVVNQTTRFLTLDGIGRMQRTDGTDSTAYAWTFSGDGTGGTFTFSQTNSTAPVNVSETSEILSMTPFLFAILAICAWDRRRLQKGLLLR